MTKTIYSQIREWARSIFRPKTSGRAKSKSSCSFRPTLEPLEDRVLLSADFFLDNGNLYEKDVGLVSANVKAFGVDGHDSVEFLRNDGNLYEKGVGLVSANVTAFGVDGHDSVEFLRNDGNLYEKGVGLVSANVTALGVVTSGSTFFLRTDHNLYQKGVGLVSANVTAFGVGDYGQAIALLQDGQAIALLRDGGKVFLDLGDLALTVVDIVNTSSDLIGTIELTASGSIPTWLGVVIIVADVKVLEYDLGHLSDVWQRLERDVKNFIGDAKDFIHDAEDAVGSFFGW